MSLPRYLQFARALALVGGLASCASSPPADETEQGPDEDSTGGETLGSGDGTADGELNGCTCDGAPMGPTECGGLSSCDECCMRGAIMVGPLSPPDLPA